VQTAPMLGPRARQREGGAHRQLWASSVLCCASAVGCVDSSFDIAAAASDQAEEMRILALMTLLVTDGPLDTRAADHAAFLNAPWGEEPPTGG